MQIQSSTSSPSALGYTRGGRPAPRTRPAGRGNLLSFLTDADRDLIAAATGTVVGADGTVVNNDGRGVDPFILELAGARAPGGELSDHQKVTVEYLQRLFGRYKAAGTPLNPSHLYAALKHVTARNASQPDGEREPWKGSLNLKM